MLKGNKTTNMSRIKELPVNSSLTSDRSTPIRHHMALRSSSFFNSGVKSIPLTFRSAKKRNLTEDDENRLAAANSEKRKAEKQPIEDAMAIENVIVNRSFRIYQVSPLYGFEYESRFLKSIARKLNFFMQKENKFGYDFVTFDGSSTLKVDLTKLCDANESIVGISLKIVNTGEYDDKSDEIFFGVMTSGGCTEVKQVPSDFVWLPLFLVRGAIEISDRITNFFTREFDCVVSSCELPSIELCWLSAMWAGFNADIPRKQLILTYVTSENVSELDRITLTVNPDEVYDLWACVHDTDSSEFVIEEVNVFMRSLERHIFRYVALDLQDLLLTEVQNTSLMINSSGKLKLFAHKTAARIVSHVASLVTRRVRF